MQQESNLATLFNRAVGFHQAGRFSEAEQLYTRILSIAPATFNAKHLLGVVRFQQGHQTEALTLIGDALKINPSSAPAYANYGHVLYTLRRFDEAITSYDKSLALVPNNPDTLNDRGNVLLEMGRPEDALVNFSGSLAIRPTHADTLVNRGHTLRILGRYAEALASLDAALSVEPKHVEGLNNRGTVLRDMGRFEQSLADYERALAVKPEYVEALNNCGAVLQDLKRLPEALRYFDTALKLVPNHVSALINRGMNLRNQGQLTGSLASFDAAITVNPRHAEAFYQRGCTLQIMNRWREAIANFETAISLNPGHPYAFGNLASSALHNCDWERINKIAAADQMREAIIPPLIALGYFDDPALHRAFAARAIKDRIKSAPALWNGTRYEHDKIRVIYVSTDFREHPVAFQLAELFERHDRSQFDVCALSIGPDDGSPMRARLAKAFDQFYDGWTLSDLEAARLLRSLEADIIVDLGGHTFGARPELFSHRPAPVQVTYLGYPGTVGADFIDYIIADRIVAPFDHAPFFAEKIVHLPYSFWPSDSKRPIAARPTRADVGLPDYGFVFCAFNNNWKITAPVFDIWMRLLDHTPQSILWLRAGDPDVMANLRAAARTRGIDPCRLFFAPRTAAQKDHLARLALADMFLDTLPYNAHASANDALWSGLPLLTCRGHAFAGRVAASMLETIGVPELVTENLRDYEALAAALARDPFRLAGLRAKLEHNRTRATLFDSDRLRRHLESAYAQMWEIAQHNEPPRSFAVPVDPAGY
jgi:protein O-GlcNAc transferase